jgi:hypothetical protein
MKSVHAETLHRSHILHGNKPFYVVVQGECLFGECTITGFAFESFDFIKGLCEVASVQMIPDRIIFF